MGLTWSARPGPRGRAIASTRFLATLPTAWTPGAPRSERYLGETHGNAGRAAHCCVRQPCTRPRGTLLPALASSEKRTNKQTPIPCRARLRHDQYMLAFDEIWPTDVPVLQPIHLDLPRPCVVDERGPVFLMPMHRRGRGIDARDDELFPQPPPIRREDEDVAARRDKFCFEDESHHRGHNPSGVKAGGAGDDEARRGGQVPRWATIPRRRVASGAHRATFDGLGGRGRWISGSASLGEEPTTLPDETSRGRAGLLASPKANKRSRRHRRLARGPRGADAVRGRSVCRDAPGGGLAGVDEGCGPQAWIRGSGSGRWRPK